MTTVRIYFWAALAVVFGFISTASAAITADQRKEVDAIKAELDKAGKLFTDQKFKEAGDIIRDVQARMEKYAETADAGAIKLLDPVVSRLKKAHPLLELEGVELPPLKQPVSGVEKPATKPMPMVPAGGGTSFVKEVVPILNARCGGCHVRDSKGKTSFASYAVLMKGNADGVLIFAGDDVGSRVIEVIEEGSMPKGGGKLTPAEFATLKKWIKEGAKFDGKDPTQNLANLTAGDSKPDAPAANPTMVATPTGKETISFARDVAPVLADTCYNCHGGGNQTRAMFNLITFNGLIKGGDSGSPITAGKGADSLLVKKLKGTADGMRMPQNLPALPDATIAKIEKWIDEGAKYDGGDPAMNVKQVAALGKANSSTHEELAAERVKLSEAKWRLALASVAPTKVETKNFLLLGNVGENTLTAIGEAAENVAPKVGTMLKAPANLPLIKGRMTLFVFDQRYDYAEFGNMVERRELPKSLKGHFAANPVEVYGAILPSKSNEYSVEAMIGQQIAGAYVANIGKSVPRWFSEGTARAVAAKLAPDDARVAEWDNALPALLSSMQAPNDFLEGKMSPEEADIANFSFVRYLMNDSKKFDQLLTGLKNGQDFTQTFSNVYKGSPAQLSVMWAQKGAITKRPAFNAR